MATVAMVIVATAVDPLLSPQELPVPVQDTVTVALVLDAFVGRPVPEMRVTELLAAEIVQVVFPEMAEVTVPMSPVAGLMVAENDCAATGELARRPSIKTAATLIQKMGVARASRMSCLRPICRGKAMYL